MPLIKEMPFSNSSTVICGVCRGQGALIINQVYDTCYFCKGHGRLTRETEGTMRLYTINTKNNDTIL